MYVHRPISGRRLDSAERCGRAGNLESSILRTRPGGGVLLSAALEPSTGLDVGSRGELEGQCSAQHTLCGLEEASPSPLWLWNAPMEAWNKVCSG